MRNIPHSVAVVTAFSSTPSLDPCPPVDPDQDCIELLSPYYHNFCGATISSLQSVTLGPPAMVSFNLKMPSKTLSGLLHHKHFGIHLLKGTVEGQKIADAFIQQSHHEAFRALSRSGHWVGLGLRPTQKVEKLERKVPVIRGEGVYNFMRCEVVPDKTVQVGDHMVVIARVASIGTARSRLAPCNTLSYIHGNYHGKLIQIRERDEENKVHHLPIIADIGKISSGVHMDAVGLSGSNMEATLEEFCERTKDRLPRNVREFAASFLRADYSWPIKAFRMEQARKACARGERPTFKFARGNRDLKKNEDMLYSLFMAGIPRKFWSRPKEQWPDVDPPWEALDDDEKAVVIPTRRLTRRVYAGKEITEQTSDMKSRKEILAVGSDPLGSIGDSKEGDLTNLAEEGYQNLAMKTTKQKQEQDKLMAVTSAQSSEGGLKEGIREENDSVEADKETNTGIPAEEEAVLKNSPS